jgi:hypothetical protein
MKILKLMPIMAISLLIVCFSFSELSAKGQRCKTVRVKKSCRSSSFNVNLNVDSSPNYVAYAPPAYVAPVPYYQSVTTYNTPYQSVTTYSAPCAPPAVYYPCYPQPVVVERQPSVGLYFQPSFSYWRY